MISFQEFREKCSASLWIVPAFMGVLGFIIFILSIQVELQPFLGKEILRNIDIKSDSLSVTVGTLLAAVITVFGIILPMKTSIIMRASNQHTPMVIRTYRTSLPPKLFIGFSLLIIVYLIISLLYLKFTETSTFKFQIVVLDFTFVAIGVLSIPKYLDYLIKILDPNYLASQVYAKLESLLAKSSCKEEDIKLSELSVAQDRSELSLDKYKYQVYSVEEGYLQTINIQKLIEICKKHDIVIGLPYRTGEFIFRNSGIIYIQSIDPLVKSVTDSMLQCFHFGPERVSVTDMEILIDKLVYIQLKALSPGVNDLSTAIKCLNFIGASCNLVLDHPFKEGIYYDQNKDVRVYSKEFDFEGFVHCAFDRMNSYYKRQVYLAQYALRILKDLIKNCQDEKRSKVLQGIADRLAKNGKDQSMQDD